MSDTSDIIGFAGGGAGLLAGIAWLVRTLAGRVVEREDKDKESIQKKVDERERREREMSEILIGIKHTVGTLREGQESLARQMESRASAQDRENASLRAEMKEQISQLEHRLRSDMQRIVSAPSQKRGRARD